MGLQPIQKRHANKELDVLLSQDCCCHRCPCPGEHRLAVISCLSNTPALKSRSHSVPQIPPPVFCQDVHLSFTCSAKHERLTHFLCLSQIKEAADIIQKLHLIAQELPFDRWVAPLWHETRAQSNQGKVGRYLIDNEIFSSNRFADVKAKIASKKMNKTIVCCSIRYIYIKMLL